MINFFKRKKNNYLYYPGSGDLKNKRYASRARINHNDTDNKQLLNEKYYKYLSEYSKIYNIKEIYVVMNPKWFDQDYDLVILVDNSNDPKSIDLLKQSFKSKTGKNITYLTSKKFEKTVEESKDILIKIR